MSGSKGVSNAVQISRDAATNSARHERLPIHRAMERRFLGDGPSLDSFYAPRSQVAEPQNVLRCANSDLELLALPLQLLELNHCSRNTPFTACSSAGLMSFEFATVAAKSGAASQF